MDHDHAAGAGHNAPGIGDLVDAVSGVFQVEPKRSFRFSGQVLANGAPMPNAEVVVREGHDWMEPDGSETEMVLQCNGAGMFEGEFEIRTRYRLVLEPRALALQPKDVLMLNSEAEDEVTGLVLELYPEAEFHGTVVSEDGQLVEGAEVELNMEDHWSRRRAGSVEHTTYAPRSNAKQTTKPDGRFSWRVAEGKYTVRAKHAELGEGSKWNVEAAESPYEVELAPRKEEPKTRILGRVFGPDGRPKEGATVLYATSGPRTTTDENGEFVLDGATKHWSLEPEIVAFAEGAGPVRVPLGELTELIGPLRIDLPRGGVLAGRVVDGEGAAVPSRQVYLVGLHEFSDGSVPMKNVLSLFGDHDKTKTDAEGFFRFDSLPMEQFTVAVGPIYAPEASVQAIPDQSELLLRIGELAAPSVEVTGIVTRANDGAPLPGAKVQVNRVSRTSGSGWSASSVHEVETDEDGRYRFEGLPEAEYYFEAILDGYARGKTAPEVEEAGVKELHFRLYQDRTVRIVVRDADGNPVAGAQVSIEDETGQALMIWSEGGSGRTPARADDDGVVIAHRMPGGPVTVEVRGPRGGPSIRKSANWSADIEHELVVQLERD